MSDSDIFLRFWLGVVEEIETGPAGDDFFPISEDIDRYDDLIREIKNIYHLQKSFEETKKVFYNLVLEFDCGKAKYIKKIVFDITEEEFKKKCLTLLSSSTN